MSGPPSRPRLADHVSLRQHVRGDDAWVLVRADDGQSMIQVGPREGAVLLAADGTRDPAGIALAVRRRGVVVGPAAVEELFASLAERGLTTDGPPEHDPDVATLGAHAAGLPLDRAVVGLPGYRFHCDGEGACCRQYESILLTPADRARALAAYAGERVGPWPIEHAFPPQSSSAPSPVRVVTTRNDGCMFLENDGRCGIHCRAGAEAKPAGCQLFPLRLVDDGEVVRATAVSECRCVLTPAPSDAAPLLAASARVRDLPTLSVVRELPPQVQAANGTFWTRAQIRDWTTAAVSELEGVTDAARWCWDQAASLPAAPEGDSSPLVLFRRLARRCAAFSAQLETWRHRDDHLCRVARWISLSTTVLTDPELALAVVDDGPSDPRTERLATQLMLWGFVGLGRQSVAGWLRDRSIRLWVARAMEATRTADVAATAYDQPIATLDALLRGHGLRDYATKHGDPKSSSPSS